MMLVGILFGPTWPEHQMETSGTSKTAGKAVDGLILLWQNEKVIIRHCNVAGMPKIVQIL